MSRLQHTYTMQTQSMASLRQEVARVVASTRKSQTTNLHSRGPVHRVRHRADRAARSHALLHGEGSATGSHGKRWREESKHRAQVSLPSFLAQNHSGVEWSASTKTTRNYSRSRNSNKQQHGMKHRGEHGAPGARTNTPAP